MERIIKELQAIRDKRLAQSIEQQKKIDADLDAIEQQKKRASEAVITGDAEAYADASKRIKQLENEVIVLTEFKQNALDKINPASDPKIMELWGEYSEIFDKDFAPKIRKLNKLKQDLYNSFLEVFEMQEKAIKERTIFISMLSEEAGVDAYSASKKLPLKTVCDPKPGEMFVRFFAEEIEQDPDHRKASDIQNKISQIRRA